jgi:hypothetical protein
VPNETHILQAKVDRIAHEIAKRLEGKCHVTLVAFYNGVSVGGVGFCSNLDLDSLVATVEARIVRWCGAPLPDPDPTLWVPGEVELKALAEYCRDELPLACAFGLFCGAGVDHVFASYLQREDLLVFFHETLLPQLKARQAVAPQPEAP